MLSIRFKAGIPAAVAAEVSRIEQFPAYEKAEGSAYRAAWDRLGSPYMRHYNAHRADCAVIAGHIKAGGCVPSHARKVPA